MSLIELYCFIELCFKLLVSLIAYNILYFFSYPSVCLFHSIQSCCILCCVCSHWHHHFSRMCCHWHMPCLSILGSCHLGRYNSTATTHQRRQHLFQGFGSGKRIVLCTFSLQLDINDQVRFSTNFKVALRCSFAQTYYVDTRTQVW